MVTQRSDPLLNLSCHLDLTTPSELPLTIFLSTDNSIAQIPLSPSVQFAICSPVCNFHTRSEPSWAQVTILYLSVVCMKPKTEPICSRNLLWDFIGFVSFVKTAGSKDVFIREDFGRLTQNRVSSSSANLIAHLPRNVSIIRCWRHAFCQA